jgi:hypothetical protein
MTAFAGLLFAEVAASSSGSNEIVAADAQHRIKVVSYVLVADSAVTAQWKSGTTALSGAMSLAANGGVAATSQPNAPFFATAKDEALNLDLGGAVGVNGHIAYVKEPY